MQQIFFKRLCFVSVFCFSSLLRLQILRACRCHVSMQKTERIAAKHDCVLLLECIMKARTVQNIQTTKSVKPLTKTETNNFLPLTIPRQTVKSLPYYSSVHSITNLHCKDLQIPDARFCPKTGCNMQ